MSILSDIPKEDRQQSAHPPYENTIIFILIKASYVLLRAGWGFRYESGILVGPIFDVPDLGHPILIKLRFVGNQQNRAFIFFQSTS